MFIDEVVEKYNELNKDSDREIVGCKHCGNYSMWGGYEDDPTMWSCEECGETFCDRCAPVDNENDDRILCLDCRGES